MELGRLGGIIFEAKLLEQTKHHDRSKILILLKESEFEDMFKTFVFEKIGELYQLPIPPMFKCLGFEFRPHNIENQDVLICLKHNVK